MSGCKHRMQDLVTTKKVKVGNDQENAKSEKNPTPTFKTAPSQIRLKSASPHSAILIGIFVSNLVFSQHVSTIPPGSETICSVATCIRY